MTQRVFDVENEKDMQDLWSILPDDIEKIEKYPCGLINPFAGFCNKSYGQCLVIKIDWHGKIEITRPIQEATEQDIGKLCVFSDNDFCDTSYGILEAIKTERGEYKYLKLNCLYKHCRRLTAKEIKELC